MESRGGCDHEWHQKVKGEEPGQSGIVNREPTPEPRHQRPPEIREGGKKVCDHRRTPESHLTSRQYIP